MLFASLDPPEMLLNVEPLVEQGFKDGSAKVRGGTVGEQDTTADPPGTLRASPS